MKSLVIISIACFQGCYNYITNIIHDDEYLGIVWFDSSTVIAQNLTQINNDTRVELLNSLPTEAYGGTSIGGGKCLVYFTSIKL